LSNSSWVELSSRPTSTSNVGTYKVQAIFAANTNYKSVTAERSFSITQRSTTVTAGSNSKTYDSSALTYNSASASNLVSGHTLSSYSVSGTITNVGSANNTVSSAVIKSGNVDVTSNYSITYAKGTLTVSARATTITAGSSSRAYNGSALTNNTASASNLVSGHTMTCTVTGSQTNAGSSANVPSAATIKDANGNNVTSNYSISYANGTLTVNKATPTTNLVVQQTTYPTKPYVYFYSNIAGTVYETSNGTQLTASNYSSAANNSKSVTAGNGSSTNACTVDYGSSVNSWTIYTYFVPTDTTNYNAVAGGPKTLSMAKAACNTGTVSNPSAVTYNHNSSQTVQLGITGASGTVTFPTSISVTKSNSSVSGWTCTSAGVVTIPANTPTGSYTISGKISVAASTNYNSGSEIKAWTVTVNAKSISIPTPVNASKTYNGTSAAATFYGAEGANITKYRYSTDNSTWTETTTNPSYTSAGTLYAQAYYSASDNYTGSNWSASATITISKRPINITAGSYSKTYDGSALTYNSATAEATGTNRGLLDGHTMTCTVTGSQTNAGSSANVPSAAVIKRADNRKVTSNYSITYINGTLTVSKADQNVSFTNYASWSTLNVGDSMSANISQSPSSGGGGIYFWSSNTNVAKTNSNGLITAVAAGSCTITVTKAGTSNYNEASQSKTLTVQAGVTMNLEIYP
jgi:hypothetical protein